MAISESNNMWYRDDYDKMFKKARKAQKLIQEAKDIAEYINREEGLYYGDPTYTPSVLERYFEYFTHLDIEEYWESSTATC